MIAVILPASAPWRARVLLLGQAQSPREEAWGGGCEAQAASAHASLGSAARSVRCGLRPGPLFASGTLRASEGRPDVVETALVRNDGRCGFNRQQVRPHGTTRAVPNGTDAVVLVVGVWLCDAVEVPRSAVVSRRRLSPRRAALPLDPPPAGREGEDRTSLLPLRGRRGGVEGALGEVGPVVRRRSDRVSRWQTSGGFSEGQCGAWRRKSGHSRGEAGPVRRKPASHPPPRSPSRRAGGGGSDLPRPSPREEGWGGGWAGHLRTVVREGCRRVAWAEHRRLPSRTGTRLVPEAGRHPPWISDGLKEGCWLAALPLDPPPAGREGEDRTSLLPRRGRRVGVEGALALMRGAGNDAVPRLGTSLACR